MAAGFSVNKNVKNNDVKLLKKLLQNSGKLFLIKENQMDSLTALSGSGPAFLAYFIKSLTNSAIKNGLDKKIALKLAIQTTLGTSKLLTEKNIEPKELINIVASPKGTTEAGLKVLDNSDFNKIIERTIYSSVKRSKQLSK
jgi:pyrroline-5-carboxylate reductase